MWQEILDDSKLYPDDIALTVNGKNVTLGELRGLSKKQREAFDAKAADLDKKRNEAAAIATKAAELQAELEKKIAAAGTVRPSPSDDEFDNDPFYAPVRKRFSGLTDEQKKIAETINGLQKLATNMTALYMDDRWGRQYDANKTRLGDKAKEWTREKLRDLAAEKKLLDAAGLPSIELAINSVVGEDELSARIKAAREEGLREGMTRARVSAMPRPTSATGGAPPSQKPVVAEKGLEGLGDDVANDPDLMRMLSDLNALDPNDFGGQIQ